VREELRSAHAKLLQPAIPCVKESGAALYPRAFRYNIWYGKFIGENWSDRYFKDREASATRCRVALDAGKTIAGTDAYICLHFARGNCSNGSK
jgi:hypothetical protein